MTSPSEALVESPLVMVGDDDDDMRTMVVTILRTGGYSTVEARDGEELLGLLGEVLDQPTRCPAVLVADVRMPRLSGLGVLHALRRARWSLPVVVMSGALDESIFTMASRLGAVGTLHKPFASAQLLDAVSSAIRKGDSSRPPPSRE